MTTILASSTTPAHGQRTVAVPPVHPRIHPDITRWRRDAAQRLGASPAAARHFGDTGLIDLGGQPLSLHPLQGEPTGPWVAVTRAARPEQVHEDRWRDALLLATGQSLAVTHAAFGLADNGDAVAILRTAAGHDHPDLLAVELAALLNLRQALLDGLKTPVEMPAPLSTSGHGDDAPGSSDVANGANVADTGEAPYLEAPEPVLSRVHGALLHLGLSPEAALAGSRSGAFMVDGISIGLACDAEGDTLVVTAELGTGALDAPERRRLALEANPALMAVAGVAIARDRGLARLMARCPTHLPGALNGDEPPKEIPEMPGERFAIHFAAWLREFARLALAASDARIPAASH